MSIEPAPPVTNKTAKIVTGVFAALTFLFVCVGWSLVGLVAANGSESEGVAAMSFGAGPGCCALSGFGMSMIGLFALKGKDKAQLIAPIVVGVLGGLLGSVGTFIFFKAIFPAL